MATRVFPLYEVFGGKKWELNAMPEKTDLTDYLNAQGRFKSMPDESKKLFQRDVDEEWALLTEKCRFFGQR